MFPSGSGIARVTSLLIGDWHAPKCGVSPPAGDFIWYPGGDYCEWTTNGRGTVGAQRDEAHRVHIIRLDRQTTGAANAQAVLDSLGGTLRSWGLAYRDCGSGSTPAGAVRAWLYTQKDLVFHISEITPATGRPRLLGLAVDDPKEFPDALCRAAASADSSSNPQATARDSGNSIPVTLRSGAVVNVRGVTE